MSVNKVILLGNVGHDPKITWYEGGNCVAQFSLATTERGYTLQNGTQIPDRTEWHNLIMRGRLAETVEKYVHKGDKLYVEGKIRTRSYDDQSGIKRYVTEIFVDVMEMLTPKQAQPATAAPGQPAQQMQQNPMQQMQNQQMQQNPLQQMQQMQAQQMQQQPNKPAQNDLADDLPF